MTARTVHLHPAAKRALTLAAFLTLTLPPAISHTTAAHAASPSADTGTAGPLHPPAAAAHASGAPSTGARAFGAVKLAERGRGAPLAGAPYSSGATTATTTSGATTSGATTAGTTAPPASVDLSANAPPIGNQGSVNSCIAWVTNYYLRGYYARRDGAYPAGGTPATGSFAPMYTYAQLVNGQNVGTSFNGNLDLLQSQGTDTRGDYAQGDVDYTDKPTAAETANAVSSKIAGWSTLPTGSGLQQALQTALASGTPVGLGIAVYHNFYNATSTSAYVDVPPAGDSYIGNHGVTAFKYDANGVWVANQWGTGFGLNGWVELSWAFINNSSYIWQAVTVTPATTPTSPTVASTATATATNTPAPSTTTSTRVPSTATATATNTPVPPTVTATNTPVPPTATATNTPVPPVATDTPVPPTATNTPAPPAATNTPAPPAATNTPVPPTATATNTPVPPVATDTPVPPTATNTPAPPAATNTPAPPAATSTPLLPAATTTTTLAPPTATATDTSRPTLSSARATQVPAIVPAAVKSVSTSRPAVTAVQRRPQGQALSLARTYMPRPLPYTAGQGTRSTRRTVTTPMVMRYRVLANNVLRPRPQAVGGHVLVRRGWTVVRYPTLAAHAGWVGVRTLDKQHWGYLPARVLTVKTR